MAIAGIEQIDSSSNQIDIEGRGSSNSVEGREKVMNVILLIMVFVLLALFGYLFFTDRLVVGIENPFSKGGSQTPINDQEEVIKTGEFHLTMEYGSSFIPPYRVCFSSVSDISKVFCFVDDGYSFDEDTGAKRYRDGAEKPNMAYENTLVEGVGVLPVGEYTMEYKLLEDVDYYVWNPCVKSLNGSVVEDESLCSDYYKKLETSYVTNDWLNFRSSYINSYGGNPIVINIEDGKRTEIGQVAAQPYINYSFMSQE